MAPRPCGGLRLAVSRSPSSVRSLPQPRDSPRAMLAQPHRSRLRMLAPFFVLAGQSPTRQFTLRRVVVAHVGLLLGLALIASRQKPGESGVLFGDLLLVAGIVEGAILVGWRLAQMPKSQALEFLLVSPIQPRRVLFAEALVGLAMLSLVSLSGLPALLIFAASGVIDPLDVPVLVVMPFTWGAVTGLGLTAWAYEPK